MNSSQRIIEVLRRIPRGRVSSYGAVAARAGLPNGARQVARLLHSSSRKEDLPWFRVVRSDGSIALEPGCGFEEQSARLAAEGVEVGPGGRVDLDRFGWVDARD
ncbi:MAG: MGMT family protein [Spirochaetales bacterium]|nr:MGMT family protein [Spirochaetales bacterium]